MNNAATPARCAQPFQPWDTQLDEAFEEHRGALRMSRHLKAVPQMALESWVNQQGCVCTWDKSQQ